MLQANEIAPRNPESLGSQEVAPDTPPTSLGKVIPKVESDSEEESEDEEGKRERALLVCFRYIMVNFQELILSIC